MVKLFDYTKEFKYNLTLSYPVTLGLLGHTIVQLTDNIMVGKLGTNELAAVSLGNSFILDMLLLTCVKMHISMLSKYPSLTYHAFEPSCSSAIPGQIIRVPFMLFPFIIFWTASAAVITTGSP